MPPNLPHGAQARTAPALTSEHDTARSEKPRRKTFLFEKYALPLAVMSLATGTLAIKVGVLFMLLQTLSNGLANTM